MKTALKIAFGALTLSALASTAFAQNSATVTTTGTATIIQPISISGTNMAFGTLVKPASGSSTVTLSNSANTITGTVTTLASSSPTRATYSITGEGAQAISVTVPANFTMNGPSSSTLVVTLVPATLPTALSGTIGTTGNASLGVGGSLLLDSTAVAGSYSGTFNVTVGYN